MRSSHDRYAMSHPEMFRPNVAGIVQNTAGKVLICQRADNNEWQFPQGGIQPGEDPLQALFRELREEIGVSQFRAVKRSSKTYRYRFPSVHKKRDEYVGQEQYFYLVHYFGSDDAITIDDREFKAYKWVDVKDILSSVEQVRVENYEKVIAEFF